MSAKLHHCGHTNTYVYLWLLLELILGNGTPKIQVDNLKLFGILLICQPCMWPGASEQGLEMRSVAGSCVQHIF